MLFRKPVLSILLFISCNYISAQYNNKNEWYIGFSGGETMSTITLVPRFVDMLFTYNNDAGLTIRYVSEDHFGIQAEINYSQSGWKEYFKSVSPDYSYSRKLSFVEVPFLLHAYTGTEHTRYFLNIGPKIGYLLSESEVSIEKPEYTRQTQNGKLVENPFQYGILGGAGFEFHIWKTVLGIEGRYCYQFSNIFNDEIGANFNTSSLQTISINAHLLFRLK